MSMAKRILLLCTLCAMAMMALAGCGGNQDTGKDGKVLRVGSAIDFAPFEFQDEGQKEYQGFDMDIIRAIGKEMGYTVEIQNLGFDGLIPSLQSGQVDVAISGMTITEERKGKVLFSDPYYQSGLTMVVREDEESIKQFTDLPGHKIAVQMGTTSAREASKLSGVTITEFNTPVECFMELKAGGVDAVINDRPVNDYFLTKSDSAGLKALDEKLTSEDYGIAMSKQSGELQKKINDALKKMHENGEYDKIYQKWFGETKASE